MLKAGIAMLFCEFIFLASVSVVSPTDAIQLLTMIAACHLAGRLAFIGVGLESGYPGHLVIPIIIYHNTAYLFTVYALLVEPATRAVRKGLLGKWGGAMVDKTWRRHRLLSEWSLLSLCVFVWLPLPWTGALSGSLIARLEGYSTRTTLQTVVPAMWIGVISWTIWFEALYGFIDRLGKGNTIFLSYALVAVPVMFLVIQKAWGRAFPISPTESRDGIAE